jgi:CRP-like cAMP-binding protein
VRFKYNENEFRNVIQNELAKSSQIRFWELHALMKSPLLKNLPYDSYHELLNTGKQLNLKKSEILFSENSFGASFFILVQGTLRVFQKGIAINQLGQGDLFGEISLFISGGKRTATITALTDCVLIEISKDHFYQMLSRNFLLACEIESLAWERIKRDQIRMTPAKSA